MIPGNISRLHDSSVVDNRVLSTPEADKRVLFGSSTNNASQDVNAYPHLPVNSLSEDLLLGHCSDLVMGFPTLLSHISFPVTQVAKGTNCHRSKLSQRLSLVWQTSKIIKKKSGQKMFLTRRGRAKEPEPARPEEPHISTISANNYLYGLLDTDFQHPLEAGEDPVDWKSWLTPEVIKSWAGQPAKHLVMASSKRQNELTSKSKRTGRRLI